MTNVYAEKMRGYRLILRIIFPLVTSNFFAYENLQNDNPITNVEIKLLSLNVRIFLSSLFSRIFDNIRHRYIQIRLEPKTHTASFEAFIGKADGIRRTSATVLRTLRFIREYISQVCSTKERSDDLESTGSTSFNCQTRAIAERKRDKNRRMHVLASFRHCTTCNPSDTSAEERII